jgi:hypothetical protein
MIPPRTQFRHHDYVLGPNQDNRLATVAPNTVIDDLRLTLDTDAPWTLTSRGLWCQYKDANTSTQNGLQGISTRWAGPREDYKQQDYVSEACSMAYFGNGGNLKPEYPNVDYPAGGILSVQFSYTGTQTLTNLSFLFRGYKRYPLGAVPGYSYPDKMKGMAFFQRISVLALGVTETRTDQVFTVPPDFDIVIRGLQLVEISTGVPSPGPNISLKWQDFNKKPYSNDYVRADVGWGFGAAAANVIPIGPTPSFLSTFGTGPGSPGLFVPEIYLPANHQAYYAIQRNDSLIAAATSEDLVFMLIAQKVFPQ